VNELARTLQYWRKQYRQWRLEKGEAGWGRPVAKAASLSGLSLERRYRVAVIGAGNQGLAQCAGIRATPGAELAGVADLDPQRRARATSQFSLSPEIVFSNAAEMLERLGPVDLVSIATTAPYHVDLACMASRKAPRILIEKPLDTSLSKSRAFQQSIAGGTQVGVNYSRRWLLDFQAIRRCLEQGGIGEVRSIAVIIGKGELAMHGSHYFDLCRFLLQDDPAWAMSRLEPPAEENSRGRQYNDPSGFALFQFRRGGRAFIDFSSDLPRKDSTVLVKGTHGSVTIDERRLSWSLVSQSQRNWTVPFAEPMSASLMFRRVLVQMLTGSSPLGTLNDGIQALEMIYGAHLSSREESRLVNLPLPEMQPDLDVVFP